MKLDRDQRRIVKAIVDGYSYEGVMAVIQSTIGHAVYEYVKVNALIGIIKAFATQRKKVKGTK